MFVFDGRKTQSRAIEELDILILTSGNLDLLEGNGPSEISKAKWPGVEFQRQKAEVNFKGKWPK